MFLDLCLQSVEGGGAGERELLLHARELGYECVALTHFVSTEMPSCPIVVPEEWRQQQRMGLGPRPFRVLTRLDVELLADKASFSQMHNLKREGNTALLSYDLLSVKPCNEAQFRKLATEVEVDIISVDLAKRPFKMAIPIVKAAVRRGVMFEVCYGASLAADSGGLQYWMSNVLNLARITKGKGLIFSSGASSTEAMRPPQDVACIAAMLGVPLKDTEKCIGANCIAAVRHGQTRKTARGAVLVQEATQAEAWQLPIVDKGGSLAPHGDGKVTEVSGAGKKRTFSAMEKKPRKNT